MTDLLTALFCLSLSTSFWVLCWSLAAAHRVPPPRSWR